MPFLRFALQKLTPRKCCALCSRGCRLAEDSSSWEQICENRLVEYPRAKIKLCARSRLLIVFNSLSRLQSENYFSSSNFNGAFLLF